MRPPRAVTSERDLLGEVTVTLTLEEAKGLAAIPTRALRRGEIDAVLSAAYKLRAAIERAEQERSDG